LNNKVTHFTLNSHTTMMAPPPKQAKSKDNEEKANSMSESTENVPDGPKLAQSRSEKKRSREQQRRNQVNEGLDKLTDLIFFIDPDLKAAAKTRAVNNNKSNVKDNQLLSRVELVDTAVATLTRVHQVRHEIVAFIFMLVFLSSSFLVVAGKRNEQNDCGSVDSWESRSVGVRNGASRYGGKLRCLPVSCEPASVSGI
jgi:hypothetical protein